MFSCVCALVKTVCENKAPVHFLNDSVIYRILFLCLCLFFKNRIHK